MEKTYLWLVSTRERDGSREYWYQRNPVKANSLGEVSARLHTAVQDIRIDKVLDYTPDRPKFSV